MLIPKGAGWHQILPGHPGGGSAVFGPGRTEQGVPSPAACPPHHLLH